MCVCVCIYSVFILCVCVSIYIYIYIYICVCLCVCVSVCVDVCEGEREYSSYDLPHSHSYDSTEKNYALPSWREDIPRCHKKGIRINIMKNTRKNYELPQKHSTEQNFAYDSIYNKTNAELFSDILRNVDQLKSNEVFQNI